MSVIVAWADARPADARRCCCLPAPWRRLCLQVNGVKVYVGGQTLRLTPTSEATAITVEEALRPEPHAWTLCPPRPPRSGALIRLCVLPTVWLLGAASEAERNLWLREVCARKACTTRVFNCATARPRVQLEDGIQLSHGATSPYFDWMFGDELGKGTFGVCRTAEHRRTRVQCACKMISRSFIERHAPAKEALEREIHIMQRLDPILAVSAMLRLVDSKQCAL